MDPRIPELTVNVTYFSGKTNETEEPLFSLIKVVRISGPPRVAHRTQDRVGTTLKVFLSRSKTLKIPHYVRPNIWPDFECVYYLVITPFTPLSFDTVVYEFRKDELVGEGSRNGQSEFPIAAEGVVELDVPVLGRGNWMGGSPEKLELWKLQGLTDDNELASLLSAEDRRIVAGWVLARLDELEKRMGHVPSIDKLREYWSKIR